MLKLEKMIKEHLMQLLS